MNNNDSSNGNKVRAHIYCSAVGKRFTKIDFYCKRRLNLLSPRKKERKGIKFIAAKRSEKLLLMA
jgi:hypothetical protein